jgi:hypothetical protein
MVAYEDLQSSFSHNRLSRFQPSMISPPNPSSERYASPRQDDSNTWTNAHPRHRNSCPFPAPDVSSVAPARAAEPHNDASTRVPTNISDMKCNYGGCISTTVFARRSDLERHKRKHNSSTSIPCKAVGCDRKRKKPIYRTDEFQDHVFSNHGENTLFKCPVVSCPIDTLPLGLLRLHFDIHHAASENLTKDNWRYILDPEARPLSHPKISKASALCY